MDAYQKLVDQFEATHPGIAVQVLSIEEILGPSLAVDKWPEDAGLRVMSAADTARWYPSLQETQQGIIQDLTLFIKAEASFQADDFYPGMLEAFQWDGGIWSLPDGAELTLFFFDEKAFDQAGEPYPQPGWSWQDLESSARALVKRESDEITRYGYVLPWGHSLLTAYLADHDVPLEDRATAPPSPVLDSPTVAQGVQWYAGFLQQVAPYYPLEDRSSRAMALIDKGRVAMWTEFAGNYGLRAETIDVGVVPFPSDGSGNTTPLMAVGHVMSAGTAHPDEAWRWLDFLSRQGPVGWSPVTVPARRSVAQASGFWDELDEELVDVTRYALDHPLVKTPISFDSTQLALELAVGAVLAGEKDVGQALADAQQEALAARPEVLPTVEIRVAEVATPIPYQPAGEKAAITFIGGYDDLSAYRELAKSFEKSHPGITVKVRSEPDYEDWLDLPQMAAASDCFRWGAGVEADDAQHILNLEPFLDADASFAPDDYYPAFWQQCERQGEIWCLPFDGWVMVIRYNKALFDVAGMAYPQPGWTLDDFLTKAAALTAGAGADKQYGFSGHGSETGALGMLIDLRGGSLWAADASPPRPQFDNPAVVEAVQLYADLARVQGVKPAVHLSLPFEEYHEEIQADMRLVEVGKVAMWIDFAGVSRYAPSAIASSGMVPFPQQDGHGSASVMSYAHYVSAQTEHPQACWAWLRFLSDHLTPITGMPVRRSLAESAAFRQKVGDEAAVVYLYAVEQSIGPASQVMSQHPWAWRTSYWFYEAYDAVLDGADAAQALDQAQHKAEAYILCLETKRGFGDDELALVCAREVDPDYPGLPWEE